MASRHPAHRFRRRPNPLARRCSPVILGRRSEKNPPAVLQQQFHRKRDIYIIFIIIPFFILIIFFLQFCAGIKPLFWRTDRQERSFRLSLQKCIVFLNMLLNCLIGKRRIWKN